MLIIVSCILKAIMWHYWYTCPWNHLWKLIYQCITLSAKAIHLCILDLKVNRFRGNNPEHNTKIHMFTKYLRCRRRKKKSHCSYKLIFSPEKPITCWFYIEVMGIMTKICTFYVVVINTYLQSIICPFTELYANPWVINKVE